jgi:putative membrane protein
MVTIHSLTPAEESRVEAAVAAAEKRTAAEFALVVARCSDTYGSYPPLWGALLALAVTAVASFVDPTLDVDQILLAQVVIFVVVGLALHWMPLRLLLVPGSVKRHRAEALARLEFAARVQGRTPEQAGVLLFVALGERQVEILVDRGIAKVVPESEWKSVVDNFLRAVRAGRVADGLLQAVEGCVVHLEKNFPPRPGQANDIPDRVVQI